MTSKTGPSGSGRVRKGATIRAGVCCHRGLPVDSVSYSGARTAVDVENAHAELSVKALRMGCAERRDDDAVFIMLRRGVLDAIGRSEWA